MKKKFLTILMAVLTITFFSSCEKDDQNCTLLVQNVSSLDAKIYIDGNYLSTVYSEQSQTFIIMAGRLNIEAELTSGQRLQQSLSIKRGESYVYTIFNK